MHTVPQSNLTNPAVQIPCKVFVGMPGLSSIHFNYSNTFFSYNDILVRTPDDSLRINIEHLTTKPGTRQFIDLEFHISLLNFGFLYKNYYFNFNVSDKIDAGFIYPTNWFQLVLAGNSSFAGQTMNLGNAKVSGIYYREWAIGVSKIIDESLTLGIRGKLLFGKANANTSKSELGLYTGLPLYPLTATSNMLIKGSPFILQMDSSGQIASFDIPNNNILSFLLNRKNKGVAFDFGFIYKYDDNITFSGSLLDLGFIRWIYYPVQVSNNTTFTYRGLTGDNTTVSYNSLQQLNDSLQSIFRLQSINKPYTTFLSPIFYLGATYNLTNYLNAGLLSHNILYHGRLSSSVTTSLNAWYKKFLSGSLSWSYINKSISNIGGGLSMRTPNFGIYIISDNIYGAFKYKTARLLNFRFGLNFLFGCKECSEKERKEEMKKPGCRIYRDAEEHNQRIKSLKEKIKKQKKKN